MASENFGVFINGTTTRVLDGTELLPVVVSSVTKKATSAALESFIYTGMSGDATATSGSVVTVNSVTGATNGTNAAAGKTGQVIESTASLQSVTSLTALGIASVALTAGRWMIFGVVGFQGTVTTIFDQVLGDINTVSGTLSSDQTHFFVMYPSTIYSATMEPVLTVPMQYVTISTNTTYYLNARAQFHASTAQAFGRITAIRI